MTVLITAEAIIAGFMIAYGALNGQLLLKWSRYGPSYMMTTYIAGIVINAIVLTCFVSIVLLFNSLRTNSANKTDDDLQGRYDAGYGLFLTTILGSMVFVFTNGFSIWHFTFGSEHMPIHCVLVTLFADVLFYAFVVYFVFLSAILLFSWKGNLSCFARHAHLVGTIPVLIAFFCVAAACLWAFLTASDAIRYCLMILILWD